MRTSICAVLATAAMMMISATMATAGDTNKPSKFTEPRLGLGAAIPDDLLFGDNALGTTKPRARVTVRSAPSNATRSKPILKGWDVKDISVNGDSDWRVSEPVRAGCLDNHAIMSALTEAGWHEFSSQSLRRRSIAFTAKRRDGKTKRVQVDRCTGEIIHVSAAYAK